MLHEHLSLPSFYNSYKMEGNFQNTCSCMVMFDGIVYAYVRGQYNTDRFILRIPLYAVRSATKEGVWIG